MSRPPQEPDQPPSPFEPPPGHDAAGQHGPPPGYGSHSPPSGYGQHGPPPGYGPYDQSPGYGPAGPPPGYGQHGPLAGPGRTTNVLAVLSLVFAFLFAPAGIVLGHLAKRQIRRTGEAGDQFATWGLILGYLFTVVGLVACCGWLALVFLGNSGSGTSY